jgi:hypothetical protein
MRRNNNYGDLSSFKSLSLSSSPTSEPDKSGRAYTCYYSKRVSEVQKPAPKKSGKKSKKEKTEIALF